MNEVLQQIRDYADAAHGAQERKYTAERYIVHPVRVMKICEEYLPHLPVLAAALLHDVLEDTPITKEDMETFLKKVLPSQEATQTMHLVVELTDVFTKQDYPKWNRRKRKANEADRIANTSSESQTIKYADIIDNCSKIVEHDHEFANRFLRECRTLLKRIPNGNPILYQKAKEAVAQRLSQLKTQL